MKIKIKALVYTIILFMALVSLFAIVYQFPNYSIAFLIGCGLVVCFISFYNIIYLKLKENEIIQSLKQHKKD